MRRFSRLLQHVYGKQSMALVAVDEAHCISSWGHDFRGAYRQSVCLTTPNYSVHNTSLHTQWTCMNFDR